MSIEETKGNLFESDAEALVNAVNCVGVMGKGIALQFAKRFPKMVESYQTACQCGVLIPGGIHVYRNTGRLNPQFIFNFPTKRHWRDRSKPEDIESGLKALAITISNTEVKSVALPALGCGNGGLEWEKVRHIIHDHLCGLGGVRVMVCLPN